MMDCLTASAERLTPITEYEHSEPASSNDPPTRRFTFLFRWDSGTWGWYNQLHAERCYRRTFSPGPSGRRAQVDSAIV